MTLFSAIVSTVDPQYSYEDENGNKLFFYLKDFDNYKMINKDNKNIKLHQLDNPISLVRKRLTILKNRLESSNTNENYILLNPGEKICSINQDEDRTSLYKEIGIKELDNLYYDVYDYDQNVWKNDVFFQFCYPASDRARREDSAISGLASRGPLHSIF